MPRGHYDHLPFDGVQTSGCLWLLKELKDNHISSSLSTCEGPTWHKTEQWGEEMGPQSCDSVPWLRVKYFYITSSLLVIQSPAGSSRTQLQSSFDLQDPSHMYRVVKQS